MIKGKLRSTVVVILVFLTICSGARGVESPSQVFEQGFEQGLSDDWIYAHADLWSTTSEVAKDGNLSLKLNGTGGREFEGIQMPMSFSNGTIEAWVFPQLSNSLEPMLYLRTSQNDGTDILTIKSGYGVRIYRDYAALFRITNYRLYLNYTVTLGEWISNKWWYMKLEVEGHLLNAWVSRTSDLDSIPLLSYNISNDLEQYHSGYPAISGRATLGASYTTHFDSLRVIWTPDSSRITEGFTFMTTLLIGLVMLYYRRTRN